MGLASRCRGALLGAVLAGLGLAAGAAVATAQSDDSIYAVSGVEVDVRASDAAAAKLQAISEAQVKAFRILVERLGDPAALAVVDSLSAAEIGRMMSSLSIEEERTGPGRYIGKLTVRFLPRNVRNALAKAGVTYTEQRAPRTVVVPVWRAPDGYRLWEDSPWRAAWLSLRAEAAIVPLIVPLGDLTDTQALTVEDVLAGDAGKLEAIRIRYGAANLLVAYAEPDGASAVRAVMQGEAPMGRIGFDKSYPGDGSGYEAAAVEAARRFHLVMTERWKKASAPVEPVRRQAAQSMAMLVPFASPSQWTAIRGRLVATSGVATVDISAMAPEGAIVQLGYSVPFEQLQAALSGNGLFLQMVGQQWVLQVY